MNEFGWSIYSLGRSVILSMIFTKYLYAWSYCIWIRASATFFLQLNWTQWQCFVWRGSSEWKGEQKDLFGIRLDWMEIIYHHTPYKHNVCMNVLLIPWGLLVITAATTRQEGSSVRPFFLYTYVFIIKPCSCLSAKVSPTDKTSAALFVAVVPFIFNSVSIFSHSFIHM